MRVVHLDHVLPSGEIDADLADGQLVAVRGFAQQCHSSDMDMEYVTAQTWTWNYEAQHSVSSIYRNTARIWTRDSKIAHPLSLTHHNTAQTKT